MSSASVRHIQGLSDRDIARLRRLAANRLQARSVADSARVGDPAWPRQYDCAVAERLRVED